MILVRKAVALISSLPIVILDCSTNAFQLGLADNFAEGENAQFCILALYIGPAGKDLRNMELW